MACDSFRTAGTRRSVWPPICTSPRHSRTPISSSIIDGSPYVDEIVAEPWRLDDDGMLAIPDRPGLGIQLDPDVIARYGDAPCPDPVALGVDGYQLPGK